MDVGSIHMIAVQAPVVEDEQPVIEEVMGRRIDVERNGLHGCLISAVSGQSIGFTPSSQPAFEKEHAVEHRGQIGAAAVLDGY